MAPEDSLEGRALRLPDLTRQVSESFGSARALSQMVVTNMILPPSPLSQVMTRWCSAKQVQTLSVPLKEKMRRSQNPSPLRKCPQVGHLPFRGFLRSVTGLHVIITVASTKTHFAFIRQYECLESDGREVAAYV